MYEKCTNFNSLRSKSLLTLCGHSDRSSNDIRYGILPNIIKLVKSWMVPFSTCQNIIRAIEFQNSALTPRSCFNLPSYGTFIHLLAFLKSNLTSCFFHQAVGNVGCSMNCGITASVIAMSGRHAAGACRHSLSGLGVYPYTPYRVSIGVHPLQTMVHVLLSI